MGVRRGGDGAHLNRVCLCVCVWRCCHDGLVLAATAGCVDRCVRRRPVSIWGKERWVEMVMGAGDGEWWLRDVIVAAAAAFACKRLSDDWGWRLDEVIVSTAA